jgi:HAD superfamily hydrolase (TIGR01509 family)
MIRAVLFDFDGLLADSEPLQKAAWRRYLAQHDRTLEQALIDRSFGLRLVESATLIRDELRLPFSVAEIMAARDGLFLASLPGALQPMPGAAETVAAVRQFGLRTALATSGHRRYIDLALHELQLTHAFDAIVTGDVVARGKPAPDIFLRAAELLDVAPAACVVVEDAPNGIAAARAAGMLAVAIPNQMTRNLDLSQAHLVCGSLDEFRVWIEHHRHEQHV